MNFLRDYGTTEGPLGIPCTDAQAHALDTLLKSIPPDARQIHKTQLPAAITTLEIGERADVSWISTEAVDRHGEIVLAAGCDTSHFLANPLVPLNHCYWAPPVGRCQWLRPQEQPKRKGLLAKTLYPPAPDTWPAGKSWEPDECLALIQAGLLNAKSVGFIPLARRTPTEKEIETDPRFAKVTRIVEKWLLLEYSVCSIGVNQESIVAAVSKSLDLNLSDQVRAALTACGQAPSEQSRLDALPFTAESELHRSLGIMLAPARITATVSPS